MDKQTLTRLLLGAAGLFTLSASVFNWDWYFNHRKARFLVDLVGRNGARAFYGLIGVGILGAALFGVR